MDWQPSADINTLVARADCLARLRHFFQQRQVLEVQTPLLGAHTVTDVDVNGIEVTGHGYLQTSPEYFMKRLLAAGMPSCYQLASVFRQDENGRHHSPEFTLLEWYRLEFDEHRLMREVGELVDMILGPAAYTQVTYWSLVEDGQGCSRHAPRHELDLAFAEACTALNPGRFFVTEYPPEQAVLARLRDGAGGDPYAARFELVIDGLEIANGYWELLDADEHQQRFEIDNQRRRDRGVPAVAVDAQLLAALEHGLPACAGVALGVDRLLMLALGKHHIQEVLAFPSPARH